MSLLRRSEPHFKIWDSGGGVWFWEFWPTDYNSGTTHGPFYSFAKAANDARRSLPK